MPVAKHTIVFARIVPSELNIVTTENNNVIDLAFTRQIKDSNGNDIWQMKENDAVDLSWNEFVYHFYGGGEKDFGISQLAGRQITMIGISGEYANGVGQKHSALTHMSDRGVDGLKYSGVSVLNDVVDSIVYDLGVPHEAWDSCSYMNVCEQLGEVHTLLDCMRVQGKLQQSCSLTMQQLVHEIASNYDENMGFVATDTNSALRNLYSDGLDAAMSVAMAGGVAPEPEERHDLVLSVMFKNSTPGVRNIEFRIHMLVSGSNDSITLKSLCTVTSTSTSLALNGTQV
tara:strand:+ start:22 stop:879 length:858 start_codon:yes stop_codon:yes gene_type:complete